MAQADGTIYINTAIEADGMKAGGKEVEAAARRMAKSVSGIGESARLALQKQTDSFVRQNQMYAQQERKVESLKSKLAEMKETRVPTERFKELEKQFEKDSAKLERLKKTQQDFLATGGKESSSAYKRRQIQIEELEKSIQKARSEQEELLRTGGAYTPVDTSAVEEQLVSEQEKLEESGNRLGTSYERLKQKVIDYGGVVRECGGYLGVLQTIFIGLKRAIEVTGMALLRFPIAVIQVIAGLVQRLGVTAKKAVIHLANLVKRSIISGFKKLASAAGRAALSLSGMNKQAKKSKNTFGKSLKTILKYTLGIRSMYILVNKIRTGIKEGFSNLAQYSGETNRSISSLMSALTQLKNSLATAFNPILTVVSPALTKLINLFSKVATYTGMFFAAFTGKKTFVKAVAVQQDYAAGLKDSASAAKEAEKATDSYLSGLDEVRRFETKDDTNKDTGAGSGELSPADMFETVPIENSIADMVRKIKDLIKNEDWEGLGAYMASGINAGLQKLYDVINWENVGPKITYFVDAFTRTFNSLVDNIDWDLMGRVIGAGINTVVNTLNLLIEGINWENLGKSFSEGFRGLLDEVEWENFGKLLGNKFMIGWRMFDGFVTDMWRRDDAGLTGWSQFGISLADALNGVVQAINFGQIGGVLGKSITGIFQSAIDFAGNFDWWVLGFKIGNGINEFLRNFDAKTVAEGTSEIIKGILDSLIEAAETVDWGLLGKKIYDLIAEIDWIGIGGKLFEFIGSIFSGLAEFIGRIVGEAFSDAKNFFSENVEKIGWDTIQGFFAGIDNALYEIGVWIKDHIFQPFIDGFKEAFGIHSPSTVMKEQGNFIMEGLFLGMDELLGKVLSVIWELKDRLMQKWEDIKRDASAFVEQTKEKVVTTWENLKSSCATIWEGIASVIKKPINAIIGMLNTMVSGVVDAVNGVIGTLNKLKVKVPKWVPKYGGETFGFNISKVSAPRIPYLATGAVIPPNAPFLALMGEQKNGTNLEAPESLIRKIVREESGRNQQGGGTSVIKLYLDGKQIAEAVVRQGKIEQTSSGRNMFALG